MKNVFADLQWDICLVFLNVIIVTGNPFANMLQNLIGNALERLTKAKLKLKAKTCNLFAENVILLDMLFLNKMSPKIQAK